MIVEIEITVLVKTKATCTAVEQLCQILKIDGESQRHRDEKESKRCKHGSVSE